MHIMYDTPGAYHVQDVCCVVPRDSSAVKFVTVESAFIVASFPLTPLTDLGGEGSGVPEEPLTSFSSLCIFFILFSIVSQQ